MTPWLISYESGVRCACFSLGGGSVGDTSIPEVVAFLPRHGGNTSRLAYVSRLAGVLLVTTVRSTRSSALRRRLFLGGRGLLSSPELSSPELSSPELRLMALIAAAFC